MENKSGIICFDVETTGLHPDEDEILQISIIDGDGNTLLNTYVQPKVVQVWVEAEKVNGITAKMVENAPLPDELYEQVRDIFASAHTWVSYNGKFDLKFLKKWGVEQTDQVHDDIMLRFAEYHHEESKDFPGTWRWMKLTYAAEHFGFDWEERAHDSLGDVKATLYVKKMLDEIDMAVPHYHFEGDQLITLYYNNDAQSGGQYVCVTNSMEDIAEAKDMDTDEFFEYLEANGDQRLIDVQTAGFGAAAKSFAKDCQFKENTDMTREMITERWIEYKFDTRCL